MKLSFAFALIFAITLSYASVDVTPEDYDVKGEELVQAEVSSLMDAVEQLHKHTPSRYHHHTSTIRTHASALVQDDAETEEDKSKSYVHNFLATQKAIRAALSTLNNELLAGHKHDEAILKTSKARHVSAVSSGTSSRKSKVKTIKHKGCPSKRAEEAADKAKQDAKRARDDLKKGKICPLGTTWGDMDVEKSVPKLSAELRSKWDKKRLQWVAANSKYQAATRDHIKAQETHSATMAAFKTALVLEAKNAKAQCDAASHEFNTLKKDVASNVATRKQVHISSLVVKCYVDNMTSNAAAKTCADKARGADVSIWNINPGSLPACASQGALEHSFGPASWTASHTNCKGVWSVTQKVICHNQYSAVGWSTKSPKSLDDCKALCAKIPGCLANGFSYVSSWKQCRLPKPNAPCKAGAYKIGAFYRQQSAEEMFDVSELE